MEGKVVTDAIEAAEAAALSRGWSKTSTGEWRPPGAGEGTPTDNGDERRTGSSNGGTAASSSSIKGSERVPVSAPRGPVIIPSPFTASEAAGFTAAAAIERSGDSARVLEELGARFVKLRASGKVQAWRKLQEDIMTSLDVLCPAVLSLKDALAAVREIEDFIKGAVDTKGRSTEDVLTEAITLGTIAGKPLVGAEYLDDAIKKAARDAELAGVAEMDETDETASAT